LKSYGFGGKIPENMPTKPRNFDPNFYHHTYNCGVEKRSVFLNEKDYQRFLDTIAYYLHDQTLSYAQFQDLNEEAKNAYRQLNPKGLATLRVKIVAYCLMPNHFHLLIKPAKEGGVTRFASDIANSYTRYFNIKNERVGNLFQGTFKTKEITNDASFLQVSRYIHLNPLISSQTNPDGRLKKLENYPYSSYAEWIAVRNPQLIDQEEVDTWVKRTGGAEKYRHFVEAKMSKDPALGIEALVLE